MRNIKLLTTLLYGFIVTLLFVATPVSAAVLSIQQLPSYITTNNFKLSCTTDSATAQFSVSKNGGGFTNFGPLIDTTTSQCVVQVDSSVVNDQTTYTFSVNGGPTTTTFYDISGPSPVSNYYKERINDGLYKLHFHTPSDSDFDKVVIYRGDTQGFSADSGHEIARVSGGANSDMSYDDSFAPDANKTYYYAIRALDHAGNSSSLVGDAGTVQGTPGPAVAGATTGGTGRVTVLPKEGDVLGTEKEASPSPSAQVEAAKAPGEEGQTGGLLSSLLSSRNGKLALIGLIGLALGALWYSSRKK